MKRVVFVFSAVPHGIATGRKELDALLATPVLTDDLAVFSIADGIFQLLSGQEPDTALVRDYVATSKLLGLYDIKQCWVCTASLCERGLDPRTPLVVEATSLEADALRHKFANCDVILRFRGIYAVHIASLTLVDRFCCTAASTQ